MEVLIPRLNFFSNDLTPIIIQRELGRKTKETNELAPLLYELGKETWRCPLKKLF